MLKFMITSAESLSLHTRGMSRISPCKETSTTLLVNCTSHETVSSEIIFATHVGKTKKCRSGTKALSQDKTAVRRFEIPKFSQLNSLNRRQYFILKIYVQKVRMQLDTASGITLISRRTWKNQGSLAICLLKFAEMLPVTF